jgi:hypothetical protein
LALSLVRFVKKTAPRSSKPFNKTIREDGAPFAFTVDKATASGFGRAFAAWASLNHPSNGAMGDDGGELKFIS